MPKYVCNWGLAHNGADYAEGEELTLKAAEAEPLLEAGVISKSGPAPKRAPDPSPEDGDPDPEGGGADPEEGDPDSEGGDTDPEDGDPDSEEA